MISDQIYSLDLSFLKSLSVKEIEQNLFKFPFSANLRMLKLLTLKAQQSNEFENTLLREAILVPNRALLKKRLDQIEHSIQQMSNQQNEDSIMANLEPTPQHIVESTKEDNSKKENEETEKSRTIEIPIIDLKSEENQNEIPKLESFISESNENFKVETIIIENALAIKSEEMKNNDSNKIELDKDDELSDFAKWLKSQSTNESKSEKINIAEENSQILKIEEAEVKPENEWAGLQEKILAEYHVNAQPIASKAKKTTKKETPKKKKKEKEEPDETSFITETYALLLEKQQKYQKALKIYDKLSLLFPEKRHYFAQKIELLKNL